MSKPRILHHPEHDWINWNGGSCPLDPEVTVWVTWKTAGKAIRLFKAGQLNWKRRGFDFDIRAYRVIDGNKPDDGGSTWTPKSGGY